MIEELNILRLMLYNKEFREKTHLIIKPYMFHDSHCGEIYDSILKFVDRYNTFPESNIEIMIMDNPWKQDRECIEKKLEIVKPDKNLNYSSVDLKPIFSQTEEFVKKRMFGYMLENGVQMYQEKGNIDYKRIQELMNAVSTFSFDSEKWIDVYDDDYMIDIITKDVPRIKFEWDSFNMLTKGGFKKKSLNIIQGGTHVGKSRLLMSMATNLRKASPSNNILYVTLEIPREDFALYSDMHLLGMTTEQTRRMIEDDAKKYRDLRAKMKSLYGKLFIVEYSATSCTPATIKNLAEDFLYRGIQLSAICVDYIGIMSASSKRELNMYERGCENAIALRSLSQEMAIPIITATQPDREGNRKNMKGGLGADMMNTAESKGLPDNCDFFGNIIQTVQDYQANIQKLYIHKNRHGHKVHTQILIEVKKDFYLCEFSKISDVDTETVNKANSSEGSTRENINDSFLSTEPFHIPDFSIPVK